MKVREHMTADCNINVSVDKGANACLGLTTGGDSVMRTTNNWQGMRINSLMPIV